VLRGAVLRGAALRVATARPPGEAWYSIVKRTQSVRVRNEEELRVPRTPTRISPAAET
jgi:hypothetical protein